MEGGELVEEVPVARPRGTTVEVRELFFNAPARRKFMRSPPAEAGHSSEALLRLALARPSIGFTLRSGGRVVLGSPPGASLRDRVAAALGRAAAGHLVAIDSIRGEVRVHGLVTSPDHSEATSRALQLFVNGRFVRDRALSWAALRAYAGTLPQGRFPAGVVFIELPLDRVDVNVHPQKLEVRFADPRGAQDAVHRAVSDALRTAPWLRHRPSAPPAEALASEAGSPWAAPAGPLAPVAAEELAGVLAEARAAAGERGDGPPPRVEGQHPSFSFPLPASPDGAGRPLAEAARPSTAGYFGELRYIGQHARTYLLCEAPDGALVVIDQHASHERLLFHRLRRSFEERRLSVQPLLLPQVVSLPPGPARALEGALPELRDLGLELEPFGGESFAVKGAPAVLGGVDLEGLVSDLARQIEGFHSGSAVDEVLHDLLATMACHSAVRAHQELSVDEARALLDGLDAIDYKARCPHGRPVVFSLPLADLERRVGRR